MNIAFLTAEYPHPRISHTAGIGTSIKNLALALTKNNHKITIFVYSQDTNEVLNDKGITIYKIAHQSYSVLGWYLHRKYLQNYLNQKISELKIQVLEAPDWTGITAFMKLKCPLVIRLHGTDAYFCDLEGRKQKQKNYFFEKKALKTADALVAVSEFTALKTKKLFRLNKKISVIHNGIDTEVFKRTSQPTIPNTLLYFGTIIRKKGVLALATIFNEVVKQEPKAKLLLVGTDVIDIFEKKSTLEIFKSLLTTTAKNNIEYKNHIPYQDIIQELEKASVVVLPSFAEAFPMTWLEAMAMGKAIVSSNIGWAHELMINEKTGFTEHPNESEAYASKIIQLLKDSALNIQMGQQAAEHIATKFSLYKIRSINERYYNTIINDSLKKL